MKKLVFLALAFVTLQVTAQDAPKEFHKQGKDRIHRMADLTPEETATLQTKKMTLALDLSEDQQAKIQKMNLENAKERKARMEAHKAMKESNSFSTMSKEDKLKMKNERLDRQIAFKKQMKEILNAEQYKKWSENMEQQHHNRERKMKYHKEKG